jgi:hypothetical protein
MMSEIAQRVFLFSRSSLVLQQSTSEANAKAAGQPAKYHGDLSLVIF